MSRAEDLSAPALSRTLPSRRPTFSWSRAWQTEGLAPVLVEALTAVLLRLREEGGLAIVLVEQNSRVALSFSARTVVMDKGRIVYDGESAALSAWPS